MKEKYKYVQNMLSQDVVYFLSSWSTKNFEVNGDPQYRNSFAIHSSKSQIYRHALHYLHPLMEQETGLSLQPTYSFNRVYLPGSDLKRHKDREECEISASITLKYFYEDKNYKWPLCMGDIPIAINSGDGVIYKGCEVPHWRPVFNQPKRYWHHQLFIHYVDLNGPYKNLKEED